jgi:hypothetical protein
VEAAAEIRAPDQRQISGGGGGDSDVDGVTSAFKWLLGSQKAAFGWGLRQQQAANFFASSSFFSSKKVDRIRGRPAAAAEL